MVQTILIINFEESLTEEKRQDIINNIYLNNEKEIKGMTAHELKKGLDKSQEIKDVLE